MTASVGGGATVVDLVRTQFDARFGQLGLGAYSVTIHPERVTIVADPVLGAARDVARFTVLDTDTGPTENPRAQLESPRILGEGKLAWFGWSLYLPLDWPVLPSNGWLTFASIYGPPFTGAGPLRVGITGANDRIRWSRDEAHGQDSPWSTPIVRGQWMDFAFHVRMSTDPAVGFAELWTNFGGGWAAQTLTGGGTRSHMATLGPANGGSPNEGHITLYRMAGMFDELTCYFGGHRIGASLASVDPRSYG